MAHIPGVAFMMGSIEGIGDEDEHPQHQVTLGGYCFDTTEVTVAAYARCVTAGSCIPADEPAKDGPDSLCNGHRADRQKHPVNCVDWDQAKTYCAWAKKRLPTEAEWEHAARGNDGRTYPWGNEPPGPKWLNACGTECLALRKKVTSDEDGAMYGKSDGFAATSPVGSFPAGTSPFGVLDMSGNVWEWVADHFGPYDGDSVTNPTGMARGTTRISRGGSWADDDINIVRGALRSGDSPTGRHIVMGFRCARGD